LKEEAEVRPDEDILNGVALRPSVSSEIGKKRKKKKHEEHYELHLKVYVSYVSGPCHKQHARLLKYG